MLDSVYSWLMLLTLLAPIPILSISPLNALFFNIFDPLTHDPFVYEPIDDLVGPKCVLFLSFNSI